MLRISVLSLVNVYVSQTILLQRRKRFNLLLITKVTPLIFIVPIKISDLPKTRSAPKLFFSERPCSCCSRPHQG